MFATVTEWSLIRTPVLKKGGARRLPRRYSHEEEINSLYCFANAALLQFSGSSQSKFFITMLVFLVLGS